MSDAGALRLVLVSGVGGIALGTLAVLACRRISAWAQFSLCGLLCGSAFALLLGKATRDYFGEVLVAFVHRCRRHCRSPAVVLPPQRTYTVQEHIRRRTVRRPV